MTQVRFRVRSFAKLYQDVFKKKLLLGLRLDGQFSGGDVPFYALPFIDMREKWAFYIQVGNAWAR